MSEPQGLVKNNDWAPEVIIFNKAFWAKGYYLMYFSTVLEPAIHNKDLLFHLSDLDFNLLKIITNVQNK